MAKGKDNGNQNKKSVNKINEEYGRVPPQAVELEEAVLGALMIDSNAILDIGDILKPESFYNEAHQKIYSAILKLSEDLQGIDMMTVREELKNRGELEEVGGAAYLAQLTRNVTSSAHLEFHAKIVAQKYIQRQLIRVGSDIQRNAYDSNNDVNDLLDYSEREIFNLATGNIKQGAAKIKDVVNQAIEQIEEAGNRTDGLSGIPSGFTQLDRITSGWQKSDLCIIAARPSMGKTAFVLSMLRNIAVEHNQAVALFSLEMSAIQLVNRLIIGETGLTSEKIRNGKLTSEEWSHLEEKIKDLTDAPFYIDDTPGISIFELRAKCRRLKMLYDVQLIVVDYLQLMAGSSDAGSREQEVSTISRGLKAIAKEMDVPIIALSQLNRSVEMRGGDKRPQISDLRESGAIEQDADIVSFIYRPERYGITQDEEGNSTVGRAEIIVAKHRNGATGEVILKFIDEQAKFVDTESISLDPADSNSFEDESGMTLGSKMNEQEDSNASDSGDIQSNFEEENNPPF